jgi:signal transduction histidine kinase
MLKRRTAQLASANWQLRQGIIRRKSMECALKKSGQHYAQLLKDSLHLQEGLRQLTHEMLGSQEKERKKLSVELQDEIGQTLLGINVRLLSLKQDAKVNTRGLKSEIASTQRLVLKSAKSVRRAARKFGFIQTTDTVVHGQGSPPIIRPVRLNVRTRKRDARNRAK